MSLCPIMSRPLHHTINDDHQFGDLIEVYCRDDCAAKRKDGGCKIIDGKEE